VPVFSIADCLNGVLFMAPLKSLFCGQKDVIIYPFFHVVEREPGLLFYSLVKCFRLFSNHSEFY